MEEGTRSIEVIWRAKKLNVEVNSGWNIEELGKKLVQLTNVNPDTLKLLVPQASGKGSKLLAPFSEDNSMLYIHEIGILKGKPIRMMGVFGDEINEVSQNNTKHDLRIAGFDEEDRRLRQLSTYKPQVLKLPQGPYIFCDFRTLELPGIKLDPAPSKALRIMHMLACDAGIMAIMNKHRWRVGIMTEMAPVGYVGISPKCILGFNKNHGEEISLRLRTDDLKGFRKYASIKKTLLHELAHMVFSEHDASFLALEKQLNEEAASLDWTKSSSHTLSGRKASNFFEEEVDYVLDAASQSYKLGGGTNVLHTARASSVAAAYNRYFSSQVGSILGSHIEMDSIKMDEVNDSLDHEKPVPTDALMLESRSETIKNVDEGFENWVTSSKSSMIDGVEDNDPVIRNNLNEEDILSIDKLETGNSLVDSAKFELDENDSVMCVNSGMRSEEPIPDDEGKVVLLVDGSKMQQNLRSSSYIELDKAEVISDDYMNDSENIQLQRIEEPVSAICAKLKESIDLLRSELTPQAAATVLQTLSKIIRNIIEHPHELKFKRIRKANPQFQRNVANYKAAMEVLTIVGFIEDVVVDEVGVTETYLILKRNDPGLLWLAKSSIEVFIA